MSYTYYYYIMIIGLVALSARGPRWAVAIALFAIAALVGNKDWAGHVKHTWRDQQARRRHLRALGRRPLPRGVAAGQGILGDKKAAFITANGGCLELFMPQFAHAGGGIHHPRLAPARGVPTQAPP